MLEEDFQTEELYHQVELWRPKKMNVFYCPKFLKFMCSQQFSGNNVISYMKFTNKDNKCYSF